MKRLYPILLFTYLLFCLDSCQKSNEFELKGEMEGLTSDMILVVYDDPESKLDTIYPRNGKFIYTFAPDTMNIFRLVNEEGIAFPVFADKGWKVSVKGSFQHPVIEGNGPNDEYQQFRNSISTLKDSAQIRETAETFIKEHPLSYASAYVINEIFAQVESPDISQIAELAQPLSGGIKDCRILNNLLKNFSEKEKNTTTSAYLSYISIKKRDGNYLSWTGKEGQYTLLHIWASWDRKSLAERDSLYNLVQKFPKNKFRVVNLSLDYDKKEWLRQCKDDTEQWIEICDCKGWNNALLKQQNIYALPANILLDQNRKILGKGLTGKALQSQVEQLVREDQKQK